MKPDVCPRESAAFAVKSILFALLALAGPAWAATPPAGGPAPPPATGPATPTAAGAATSRVVDKTDGEEEQIEDRREWFYRSRRQGTASAIDRAALRRKAADQVRADLAAQRARREKGIDAEENFWTAVGPDSSRFGGWAFGNVSGRITGIARDGAGAIYISTAAGGVWKTTNNGLSWTNLFETAGTQPTGAVAVDPLDNNVLWVGTGDFVEGCEGYFGIGLLRSGDGGATWEPRNGTGGTSLEDLSAFSSVRVDLDDSNHLVVGGTMRGCNAGVQQNGGLYTSNDGGLTWTKRIADTPVHEVAQDQVTRTTWWASTSQGVYKSIDDGVTWTKQTASGLPSSGTGRTEIAVAPSNGNVVYVLYESQGFWRTTNGGASWTQMSTGGNSCDGQCWYNMTIAVHRTNPDIVYRGTILIFRSPNGGTGWQQMINGWGGSQQVHQDIHAILIDPSVPDGFFVGGDGGMWRSTDGGQTYANMNAGLPLFLFYAVDSQEGSPAVVCGGAQDNSSLVRTTDNVWDLQAVTGDGFVCQINKQNPNYAYITSYPSGGYPSVSRSTSGVLGSFSGITGSGSGIISGDRIDWVTPYTLDPNDGRVLLLGTHRTYRSADYGSTWVPVGPVDMTGGSGNLKVVEFNRSDSRIAYAGTTDGRVWRSADNGQTWANITANLPAGVVNDLAGDPGDPGRAFVAVGGFNRPHVYEWTEATGSWAPIGGNLPNVPANAVLPKTGAEIYVGTDVGVYRSLDRGATFEPYMNGLPQGLVVTDLKFDRATNTVTAGTYGRGAYQVSVAPPEPMLLFDGVELPLAEVEGDGDENVEPGETWSLRPRLRNAGGLPALGVRARLATSSAGVTILEPAARGFGDLGPGVSAAVEGAYAFTVDPAFPCGAPVVFDLLDLSSTNEPASYGDRRGVHSVTVVDGYGPSSFVTLLDEDFDPAPPGWSHEVVPFSESSCFGVTRKDEWRYATKDATHTNSLHCGQGPGKTYGTYNNAWQYYAGKDSAEGPGVVLTPGARTATLTLTHWYRTELNRDGGQVVIDAVEDGQDAYVPLVPVGGYPGTLGSGTCNAQAGRAAFTGSSAGWKTDTFDLSPYVGRRVYLAFVFGSDKNASQAVHEGWYVDQVKVETETAGDPLCDLTRWAGTAPPDARFALAAGGGIEATWGPACNAAAAPGQLYSIQAGDLAQLAAGSYTHAPLGGDCARTSPATFTPGPGDEYYLVVPNLGGHEGTAGAASGGAVRPQPSAACGTRRAEACP